MKKIAIGLISILLSTGALFFQAKPDGLLHVFFLNVGQGDSILIRTPSGKNILVDGGAGNAVLGELKSALPFFGNTIDYILLTHPDRDHLEGLIYVLKRYPVKRVIFTGAYTDTQTFLFNSFLKTIKEKNIPLTVADQSSDISFDDGVLVDVLFPFTQAVGVHRTTNNLSIVSKIIYGNESVLLTGDSEAIEEETLLKNNVNLKATVLKVAHHGSNTSTTLPMLQAVSPEYSVISVGKNNTFRHPHPSTIQHLKEFGTEIHRTDLEGRIEFVFSKDKIEKINTQSSL